MSAPVLLGCEEPRIFTAPLRPLTPKTSHGFAAIAFAEVVLGLTLFPWQKWLLIHALELREDGTYRFRTVLLLVARQNGKTLIMLVLALWHLYALQSRTVIGTAQDLSNAEKAWAEAVEMAEGEPELAELIEKVTLGHPKSLLVAPSEDRLAEYRVATASRKGGRGFSGDLVLLDELREHQSWDSWSAVTKTSLARPKAQVWCFSNAGDYASIVLRFLRASAHQALGWPDGDADKDVLDEGASAEDFAEWEDELREDDSLGLFEYSAAPDAKRGDRHGWAQANPSMNYTDLVPDCITERAIAAAMRTDPRHVFEVEVLCRWIATPDQGPFPAGKWQACRDNASEIAEDSQNVVAVDVSWNRSTTYVALAGWRQDGKAHGEINADRAGTEWLVPWLVERKDKIAVVVVQANGAPASSLIDDIEAAGLTVLACGGPDMGKATGKTYDLVESGGLRVKDHPGLNLAAQTAHVRLTGDGAAVVDRKSSPNDAAPLVALIEALWGLQKRPPKRESIYESADFMMLGG
ncbi:terminase [Gordonia sp. HY442]|uniref:terminase n=1 Tax=Gordonia zhenghanii TaxID=2911516 RepID=UPI001F364274|nr:terminase [Gordonia zhenghanii]MCF8605143.1 terminase [Gordonia zhenghanii]